MSGSLNGRHAVVTGAGSGIGRSTAEHLAEAGCRVTLIGRHVGRLTETADRIGDAAFAAPADVTDADALTAAIEAGRDRFGPVDILINNAGAASSAPFLKTAPEDLRAMLALNLEAPAEAARLVLPGMLTRRWGRIVNVASTAGLKGYAYVSAYVAAKHGLVGLTRALAVEFTRERLRVNVVCPGGMLTPQVTDFQAPDDADYKLIMRIAAPRGLMETADVANVIAFLASDEAAAVHGAVYAIDNGKLAG